MPDRNAAPGADSTAVARRIARWAAAARPALAAAPEPGPQQAWMVMHAIAQACGDPAMRLVARIGRPCLTNSATHRRCRLGCRTPTPAPPWRVTADVRHRLPWPRRWPHPGCARRAPPSCATIASDFDTCAPTCRVRPPPWPEPRPGHSTAGSAQPGRAPTPPPRHRLPPPLPRLPPRRLPPPLPRRWADELARRAFARSSKTGSTTLVS
jgi:hypothetical protein